MTLASSATDQTNETAREIARAAARLFATQGYDATPVQAIVEAAGVTKPALYYHFKSKEGLAQALLTRPLTRLVEALERLVEETEDPIDGLVEFIDAHLRFVREEPDRIRFFYAVFFGPLGSGLAHELAGFGQRLDEVLRRAIDRLVEARVVGGGRADDFFGVMRGLIVIQSMDYLFCGFDPGPEWARRRVDDLLQGFGEPGETRGPR